MNIEELAFKDSKNLAQLNENDLLDIIEFLQNDRKQWINQFTQTHNESIDIQKENKQLKVQIKEYQKALDETMSEKIDIENNWNKLRECLNDVMNSSEDDDKDFVGTILDIMREIEQGSDRNE